MSDADDTDAASEADIKQTVESLLGALKELAPDVHARLQLDPAVEGQLDDLIGIRFEHERGLLERRVGDARRERDQARSEAESLRSKLADQQIRGALRDAAAAERVRPEALPDLLLHASAFEVGEDERVRTREGANGTTPGLDPSLWLDSMRSARPHWWPPNVSAGARGSAPDGRNRTPRHRGDFASTAEKAAWCREHGAAAFGELPMDPSGRAPLTAKE